MIRLFKASSTRKTVGWIVAVLLSVATVQAWFVSHGEMTRWYTFTDYYSRLADAFSNGQTNLLLKPHPQLLKLRNPYDEAANFPYRLHDVSYYRGQYYLYWGPAPALVLAAVKKVYPIQPGDQFLTYVAILGTLLLTALILMELSRSHSALPGWLTLSGLLTLGLSSPITILLARAAIYEAAIACGQFFLFLGTYMALTTVGASRLNHYRLGATGLAWTLAFCSRLSLAPAVIALSSVLAFEIVTRTRGSVCSRFSPIAILLCPVVLGVAGLAVYNHVRFGVWSEFGLQYQLTASSLHSADLSSSFSLQYLWPNSLAYFLNPVTLMTDSLFLVPDGPWEVGEPVAGLVHVLPYLLLALLLLIPLRRTHSPDGSQPPSRRERWLIRNLCCLALFSAVPVLVATGGAQNRYMVDVVPSLLLLAILGAWRGWDIFRHHRRVFSTLVVGLSLVSILMGISLGGFWTHYTMPYRQKTPSEWYPPEPR